MHIGEIFVHLHGLVRRGDDSGKFDGGVDNIINRVSRTCYSSHAITHDTRSGSIAAEGSTGSKLSSSTVIEAVFVDFRSSRSRESQRYCSVC
jgi:hypothetical protein